MLFDFDTQMSKSTIWAGVIGAVFLSVAQGSTQGTWQRVKLAAARDAQKAFDFAALFYVVHLLILGVGLALVVFYAERGITETLVGQLATEPDRIFPYFIATELPVGISGLFIAAIFAAAISTLDSGLAEASDLTVTTISMRQCAADTQNLTTSLCRACLWPFGPSCFSVLRCSLQGTRLKGCCNSHLSYPTIFMERYSPQFCWPELVLAP